MCWLAAAREERDDTRAQLDAANEQLEAIGSQFSSMINEVRLQHNTLRSKLRVHPAASASRTTASAQH
jgi:F0F1-type ATP synthase membrane subunit b/b'